MDESGLKKHLVTMLSLVKEYARKYSGLIGLTEETGATNYKGDNTLQMDAALERILIHYIKENLPSARIYSEEIGEVTQETEVPKYLIALDPLDGSTNYKVGKGLLPHGTLIAVYNGETPTLVDDVLVAGMIEYTTGQGFVCADGKTTTLDGTPVTIPNWPVEKNTPVYLDLYHPKGYLAYADFADSLFIRNSGSQVGNLLYLLAGASAMTGGVAVGGEEIGAIHALVKGAGGVIIDHRGIGLGHQTFVWGKKYQILAGARGVVKTCVSKIQSS